MSAVITSQDKLNVRTGVVGLPTLVHVRIKSGIGGKPDFVYCLEDKHRVSNLSTFLLYALVHLLLSRKYLLPLLVLVL